MKNKIPILLPYLFLAVLTLCACWLFAGRHGLFGAKVDWISQHSVLPAYFRQQFYDTGDLFPEFASNLGGGQDLFEFSYYGLYSPIFLLSYLLPFVAMGDYLQAASVAGLILSVWIFYYWLGRRRFSDEIRLAACALFLLAGPMIYQSCHHVMFVSYMPFLCMALLGIDRHFEEKRSGLFILSVFLMILTSFYFSIGGLLTLALYGLHRAADFPGKKTCLSLLLPTLTAVLMSAFLLLPTAYALMGKRQSSQAADWAALFLPRIPTETLLYDCYGIGLSTFVLTVLLTGLTYRQRRERILTWGCLLILIFPVFAWLLNGTLYIRDKALIPFLPLLCAMTAVYLEKQKNREIPLPIQIVIQVLVLILLAISDLPWGQSLLLADAALTTCMLLLFWKSGRILLLAAPPVCMLLAFGCIGGSSWGLMDREAYGAVTDEGIGEMITQVLDDEPRLCRLEQRGPDAQRSADLNRIWDPRQWISSLYSSSYNAQFHRSAKTDFQIEVPFRNSLMQASSNNPLYQRLMGIRYIVKDATDKSPAGITGFTFYKTDGKHTVYKNENAAPIAYATDRLLSEADYRALDFPYDQIALMEYAVVKNAPKKGSHWAQKIKTRARPVNLSLPACRIRAQEDTAAAGEIQATPRADETLLYLQFHVENERPDQDVSIWVNGTRDRLSARSHLYYNDNTTFTYVVGLDKGSRKVDLVFGKGDYEISAVRCFLGDGRVLKDAALTKRPLYQAEFHADRTRTKGGQIQGTVHAPKNGRLITSIPYDSHFEIRVNGKKVPGEKVNTAFLGFPVEKGTSYITIRYHAPGAMTGRIVSGAGMVFCLFFLYIQKTRSKKVLR